MLRPIPSHIWMLWPETSVDLVEEENPVYQLPPNFEEILHARSLILF